MHTRLPRAAAVAAVALGLSGLLQVASAGPPPAAAKAPPLVHLQVDKPTHRLGETLWWRVHAPLEAAAAAWPLTVRLVDAHGAVAAKRALPNPGVRSGAFFLRPELLGGSYWLEARGPADELLHRTQVEVWELAQRAPWTLKLTVLSDVHYPGGLVTAAARVVDAKGKPVKGERIEVLGTFDEVRVRAQAGPTDDEGRCVVRFELPREVRRSGYLAIGASKKKRLVAAAEPVRVSASVARVDAFVEGGAVVPSLKETSEHGIKHRVALLVRDLDGEPTAVEGRVFDDRQECVGTFKSDRYGHALVDVPYAAKRRYHVRVDRPAGVTETFPLPRAEGRPFALRIDRAKAGVAVTVWGAGKARRKAEVHLVDRNGDAWVQTVSCTNAKPGTVTFRAKLRGVRYVLLADAKRVYARVPVVVGRTSPLRVSFQQLLPAKGKAPLPGERVVLQVKTLLDGRPVAADLALSVYNAGAGLGAKPMSSLVARALLQPHMRGPVHDGSDLFGADGAVDVPLATYLRRRAYLLARVAYRYPKDGIARPASLVDLVRDTAAHRVSVPAIAARKPSRTPTTQRPTPLEALMLRAAFARAKKPRPAAPTRFGVAVSPRKARKHTTPGVGKPARKAPQELKLRRSKIDDRDTRFWKGRVTTDARGTARVAFRLGHEATPVVVAAQGFASVAGIGGAEGGHEAVAAAETVIEPRRFFATRFAFPNHLRVGDRCAVYVTVEPNDDTPKTPFEVALRVPACLKALDKVVVKKNPRLHGKRTKFRFEVVSLDPKARLEVVVTRGGYREITTKEFSVGAPALEIGYGASGITKGEASVVVEIPKGVVPGSIKSRARVSPTAPSQAVEGLDKMLREPNGCFEQTSSSNYPNLAILTMLRDRGADAGVLERAYRLARKGHARILTFQHPNGGFSLWGPKDKKKPNAGVEARYTALAIRQLGLHASLFQGEGLIELQKALSWLDRSTKAGRVERLYTLLAVNEAGVPWKGRKATSTLEPKTDFERALLANALAVWPADVPYHRNGKASRLDRLAKLLDRLEKKLDPKTGLASKGRGLMGSTGAQLGVEATALAGVAMDVAERRRGARHALGALARARTPWGGWYGTQASALAIMAVSRLVKPQVEKPIVIAFKGGSAPAQTRVLQPKTKDRAVVFAQTATAAPGQSMPLSLSIESELESAWSLSCTWLVTRPEDRPNAPYALSVQAPGTMVVGAKEQLRVVVRSTGKPAPKGQVTLQIGLPAGCRLGADEDGSLAMELEGVGRIEEREGQLVLYFNKDPLEGSSSRVLRLPITAQAAGTFRTGPSVVYPYYETGREAYARGALVKIQDQYDTAAAAAKVKGVKGVAGQAGQTGQAGQASGAGR